MPNDSSAKPATEDIGDLIAPSEIETIAGSPFKEKKSNSNSIGGVRMQQCVFVTADATKSVSLAVTRTDTSSSGGKSATQSWKEIFGRFEQEEGGHRDGGRDKIENSKPDSREREEEKEGSPPKRIAGVGDEAFWTANQFGGALYAFKKSSDVFIRISVGGATDSQEQKIEKSTKLALAALNRL